MAEDRPAEHRARLLAALLDPVGLLLREPSRLDVGVELGVLRRGERGAQLLRVGSEALGRVGEHGLLALLGFVAAVRGHGHAGPAGGDHAGGRKGGNASSSHVPRGSAFNVRRVEERRRAR